MASLKYRTPDFESHAIVRLKDRLGVKHDAIIAARKNYLLPHGNCYWNVEAVIEQEGGEFLAGWQVVELPNVMIVAVHHAVWRDADGLVFDVSKSVPNDNPLSPTIFISDDRIDIGDLNKPPRIDSVHVPLMDSHAISKFIERYDLQEKAQRTFDAHDFIRVSNPCENNRLLARGRRLQERHIPKDIGSLYEKKWRKLSNKITHAGKKVAKSIDAVNALSR